MTSLNVAAYSFDPRFKIYLLWTLKLMKDVPSVFNGRFDFFDISKTHEVKDLEKKREHMKDYQVIISDSEVVVGPMIREAGLKDGTIVAYIKGN